MRFEEEQPNGCWQSDFTHWRLSDGSGVEILNWLDDHSRYLIACVASDRVGGDDVVDTFLAAASEYGFPASTLTDNGVVYTARFVGGQNSFEAILACLGIRQKNGRPGHPQTQGKIERFHQTLKRWLAAQPPAGTLTQLQAQLDQFRDYYNQQRPHRALHRRTPRQAYLGRVKARPVLVPAQGPYRIRRDRVDKTGSITIRHQGRLHHLGVGMTHTRKPVLAITDTTTVTIIHTDTGEILSTHKIEPDKNYWRNQNRPPGRWPKP
jgi:hypothetical protein